MLTKTFSLVVDMSNEAFCYGIIRIYYIGKIPNYANDIVLGTHTVSGGAKRTITSK
tara:strand:- start:15 stop:182 length:168 start_codon:yes stop_codon:yes gene_type:complete